MAEEIEVVGYICGRFLSLPEYIDDEGDIPSDEKLMTVAQHERIVASLGQPAQTEQQPIRLPQRADTSHGDAFDTQLAEAYNAALDEVARLNAAPIAQTEPQPEQSTTVRVPISVIEEAAHMLEAHSPGSGSVESFAAQDLRAALSAQGGE